MAKGVIEKIKCDKCGYENEPQRIFCHECGAKLDRSEYVHEVEETRTREAKEAPHRLKDLKKRSPILTPRAVLIYGLGPFLLAVITQMLMPMNPSPATGSETEQDLSLGISAEITSALSEGVPKEVRTTQGVLSNMLFRRLKGKPTNSYGGAWVFFTPGQMTLVTRREFLGESLPLFVSAGYSVAKAENGEMMLVLDCFYIGRMKLPGALGESIVPSMLAGLPKALSLEPEYLGNIQSLEFGEGEAVLTVK